MIRAAKKDDNHNEIAQAFIRGGAVVLDVSQLKRCCDIVIAYRGITVAVEIKDGAKVPSARKLTEGEKEFADNWSTQGKWALIEHVWQVIELLNSITANAKIKELEQ